MRDAPRLEMLWRCTTRQNLTGASLSQIRRRLARAWRLMLALRSSEALEAIDTIELQLDDVSTSDAERLRPAIQLLRAVGFALQDDSLAALAGAMSHPREQQGYHPEARSLRREAVVLPAEAVLRQRSRRRRAAARSYRLPPGLRSTAKRA